MRKLKKQEKIEINDMSHFVHQKIHASNGGYIRWSFLLIDQLSASKPVIALYIGRVYFCSQE